MVRHARAEVRLGRIKGWLVAHNRALLMGVLAGMGVLFTAGGL